MSLSLALNKALTGLNVASRRTDVISSNLANALTEGYARREADVSETVIAGAGAGARVDGVTRAASPYASEARRLADADAGRASLLADASARLADFVGGPDEPGALTAAATGLNEALAAAADTPESGAFLSAAVAAAKDYAASINRIAVEVMTLRTEADAAIARKVETINESLRKIQSLNGEIQTRALQGADITALQDQRERLVKSISSEIPIRVADRDNGQIALFAANGGSLLDGRIAELGFDPSAAIGPGQTIGSGALSGLLVDGRPTTIGAPSGKGLYDGGALAAAFELRDSRLTAVSDDLDALAEDLILRTQGLASDPTITAVDAGLFTDAGAAYDPADRIGLAARVSVNPAIDPALGGETSRIRDGAAAATPGDAGESGLLRALQDALAAPLTAPSGSSFSGARSVSGFATEFASAVLGDSAADDRDAAFSAGRASTLSDAETALLGVDSDQELSQLLVVERAYAANARVIQVIDDLLERLLSI